MHTSLVRGSGLLALVLVSAAVASACHNSSSCCSPCGRGYAGASPAPTTYAQPQVQAPSAAPLTFADQAARGGAVYAARCAECHGGAGEGTKGAPALVGPTALPGTPPASREFRKTAFNTVGDVQRFVKANMPPKGAKLSDDDSYAVVAFALKANGVNPPAPLSASTVDALPLGR